MKFVTYLGSKQLTYSRNYYQKWISLRLWFPWKLLVIWCLRKLAHNMTVHFHHKWAPEHAYHLIFWCLEWPWLRWEWVKEGTHPALARYFWLLYMSADVEHCTPVQVAAHKCRSLMFIEMAVHWCWSIKDDGCALMQMAVHWFSWICKASH